MVADSVGGGLALIVGVAGDAGDSWRCIDGPAVGQTTLHIGCWRDFPQFGRDTGRCQRIRTTTRARSLTFR